MKLIHAASTISQTLLAAVLLAASCAAQQQPGTEKRQAGGERIVTGCLQRSGSSFVLNTNQGSYELNTDRDLSAFVGKQVKISGRWESTGTITTAPVGNAPSQARGRHQPPTRHRIQPFQRRRSLSAGRWPSCASGG